MRKRNRRGKGKEGKSRISTRSYPYCCSFLGPPLVIFSLDPSFAFLHLLEAVFDAILCPSGQEFGNLTPFVAQTPLGIAQDSVLALLPFPFLHASI
jgi:hypothetical protein